MDCGDALRRLPAPEPAAGIAAYERERELALARSPACRANYERYLAGRRRAAAVDYLPIKLDIENTSRCNVRCTMCVVSSWAKGKRADDLPLAAFKRLIDEQVGLLEIKLQGIGEPTLQRDDYFAMIRYARQKHIWVRTTTNGSLLHLNDNARKLIESDVNELQISIDGASRAVYEAIRRGGVFDRVMKNVRAVNDCQRRAGVERTKMWTVVQKGNIHELEALVDLAAELGFTNQVFSLELSDWGIAEWHDRNAAAAVEAELEISRLAALVERGERLGVRVRFWNVTQKYGFDSPDSLCPWPFERAYVSSDLRVVPCCFIGNPDVAEIGSGLGGGAGFEGVWKGDEFRRFRQAHLDGTPPDYCRNCYRSGAAS
ncbi:MAG: radical SAM protein [Alphaproteobacteria bacterium]|nr:radical SAM protein [Alphaproteobacteria bacterium]